MKMSEHLQSQGLLPMELPGLTSSRAASRAKTLASLENSAAWAKEPDLDSGPRLSDLLASYDRATSSWRTSQRCLLAQEKGEADGLAEFLETWPSAGMMRSGKTYQRQPWARPIAENVSGLLPTPQKHDARQNRYSKKALQKHCVERGYQIHLSGVLRLADIPVSSWLAIYSWVMGFPRDWTITNQPTEMP
jgi:hypothetical protein